MSKAPKKQKQEFDPALVAQGQDVANRILRLFGRAGPSGSNTAYRVKIARGEWNALVQWAGFTGASSVYTALGLPLETTFEEVTKDEPTSDASSTARGKSLVTGLRKQAVALKKQGIEPTSVTISPRDYDALASLMDPGDVRSVFEFAGVGEGITPIIQEGADIYVNGRFTQPKPRKRKQPITTKDVQAEDMIRVAVVSGFDGGQGLNVGNATDAARWMDAPATVSTDEPGVYELTVEGKRYTLDVRQGFQPTREDPLGQGPGPLATPENRGLMTWGEVRRMELEEEQEARKQPWTWGDV